MITAPEKELRFTRAGQAAAFWIGSAMCFAAAVMFWAVAPFRSENPELPNVWWSVVPLVACVFLARVALRLTRKAYLILTPLGVEIFPFFRPAAGMRLVSWGEIADMETDGKSRLTLHFNREKTGGIHLSLSPVAAVRRPLLIRAMEARVKAVDNS